jgi:hypothetical protein
MNNQDQEMTRKPKLAKFLDYATWVACAIGVLLLVFKK